MSTKRDAITKYIENAMEHGKATEKGDSDRTNAAYYRLMEALEQLLASDEREKLLPLLGHDDPSVRCWAATHTLPLDEASAKNVLQELSKDKSFVGFDAAIVISEWDKGTLSVP